MNKQIELIGVGSGWGAPDQRTSLGAQVVIDAVLQAFPDTLCTTHFFHDTTDLPANATKPFADHDARCQQLDYVFAFQHQAIKNALQHNRFPIVIGGDHSIAIGTWQAVDAYLADEDFSLLWFDAHLDAHTTETSPSLAPHGMPVSALLGYGYAKWQLPNKHLKPDNLYQFGIRSYEEGEHALLTKLNTHVYTNTMCANLGLDSCINEVIAQRKTKKYGISIDIDAFDPSFAPGTGTTESNGLNPKDLLKFMRYARGDENCILLEIVEFNPSKDHSHMTRNMILDLLALD